MLLLEGEEKECLPKFGVLIFILAHAGNKKSLLSKLEALYTNEMVYVSESHNRRVSIFTSDGQFVTSFGRNGRGPGEFVMTHGLAVDDCGVVYMCVMVHGMIVI